MEPAEAELNDSVLLGRMDALTFTIGDSRVPETSEAKSPRLETAEAKSVKKETISPDAQHKMVKSISSLSTMLGRREVRMKSIIFGWLLLFSVQSLASFEIYQTPSEPTQYDVLTVEESLWHLDHYQFLPGKLPQKISHQAFPTRVMAQKVLAARNPTALRRRGFEPRDVSEVKGASLWKVENQWSWDWELRYAKWVEATLTKTFFQEHRIAVDCADVALSARWIFARIHKLPVANRLAGGVVMMTQETVKASWMQLPTHDDWTKDRRFLKALDYLLDSTYTHSLLEDSYPIAINAESITAGVHHLTLYGDSGHTVVLHRIARQDPNQVPVLLIFSSVPREVREVWESPFYMGQEKDPKTGGVLRLRWPRQTTQGWTQVPAKDMPYYSLEQYSDDFLAEGEGLPLHVFKIINPKFDPVLLLKSFARQIQDSLKSRIGIVEEGYIYCQSHDCRPGTAGYEDWSTPARDQKILGLFTLLNDFFQSFSMIAPEVLDWWMREASKTYLQMNGFDFTKTQIQAHWESRFFDSDPSRTPGRRWNLMAQDFLENRKDALSELLAVRLEKLRKNTCFITDCPAGSALFIAHDTYVEDQKLLDIAIQQFEYCQNMPGALCQQLKALNAQNIFDWRGQKLNIDQLTRHTALLNSDPREKDRWGDSMKGIFLPVPDGPLNIAENKRYRTYAGRGFSTALSLQNFGAIPELLGKPSVAVGDGEILWFEDGKFYFGGHNLQNSSSQEFAHQVLQLTSLTPNFFLVEDENFQLHLFHFQGSKLTDLGTYTSWTKVEFSQAYVMKTDQKVFVFVLEGPAWQQYDVTSIWEGLFQAQPLAYSKGQLLVLPFNPQGDDPLFVLDLASLKKTVRDDLAQWSEWDVVAPFIIAGAGSNQVAAFEMDESFRVTKSAFRKGRGAEWQWPYWRMQQGPDLEFGKVDLNFQMKGLKTIPYDVNSFYGFGGPLYSKVGEDSASLYEVETDRLLFQGKRVDSADYENRFFALRKDHDSGLYEYSNGNLKSWLRMSHPNFWSIPRSGQEWAFRGAGPYLFIRK